MKAIGFIHARAHSERLPNKHLMSIGGKTIIAHKIENALNSSELDDVCVSTDCPDMLAIAGEYPVHAISRPSILCEDAGTNHDEHWASIWAHDVGRYCQMTGDTVGPEDAVVELQGNSFLFRRDIINRAISTARSNPDFVWVRTAYPSGAHHPMYAVEMNDDGSAKFAYLDNDRFVRSGEATQYHLVDGGVLVHRYPYPSNNSTGLYICPVESQDCVHIHTMKDYQLCVARWNYLANPLGTTAFNPELIGAN